MTGPAGVDGDVGTRDLPDPAVRPEKVLARDCVASIRRWGARDSFGQTLMSATDALDAPDDRTGVAFGEITIPFETE